MNTSTNAYISTPYSVSPIFSYTNTLSTHISISSTASSSSDDDFYNTYFRQGLAGESSSTSESDDLYYTNWSLPQPQLTMTCLSPLAQQFVDLSSDFTLSDYSDYDSTPVELASNEIFNVDYQSGDPLKIESCSSSSSSVSSEEFVTASNFSEDYNLEEELEEVLIHQVPRRQLPRRIPRSEKRKEQEYRSKDRELPSNDNCRSAWSRALGPNDKFRPWTPYGPRIFRMLELTKSQTQRLRMLFPYVCTGDFDIEIMIQAFRAFCKLLFELQWYRRYTENHEFYDRDAAKKFLHVLHGNSLQRLDGKARVPTPSKHRAILYWICNYKFLLHCFTPVDQDIFSLRWEAFYKSSKDYASTTSQVQYQWTIWDLFGLGDSKDKIVKIIDNASVIIDRVTPAVEQASSLMTKMDTLSDSVTPTVHNASALVNKVASLTETTLPHPKPPTDTLSLPQSIPETTTELSVDFSQIVPNTPAVTNVADSTNTQLDASIGHISFKEVGSDMLSRALKDTLKDVPKTIINTLKLGLSASADAIKDLYRLAIEKCKKAFETAISFVELLFEGCKAHKKVILYCCLSVVLTTVMVLIYKQLSDEVLRSLFVPFSVALMGAFGLVACYDTYTTYQQIWSPTETTIEYQAGFPAIAAIMAFVGSFFNLRDASMIMNMTTRWNDFSSCISDGFKWLINSIYKQFTGNHYYPEYEEKERLQAHLILLRDFFAIPNLQHLITTDVSLGADAQKLHQESVRLTPVLISLFKHRSPAYEEIHQAFNEIKRLAGEAEIVSPKTKDRIVPFVIWFDGDAGGGKSETAKNLPQAIYDNVKAALPKEYPMNWSEGMNYFKADTSQFWSNYEAFMHFCCTIEEYNSVADPATRGLQTAEFLKLVSTSIMPLDQPFQNKGKSFFGSELIIVTTNMNTQNFSSGSGATCPNALFRRRHLHLQSHQDEYFATPQERLQNRNRSWKYFVQSDSLLASDWHPTLYRDSKRGLQLRFDDIVKLASDEIIRRIKDRDACKAKRSNIDWTKLNPTYASPPPPVNSPESSSTSHSSEELDSDYTSILDDVAHDVTQPGPPEVWTDNRGGLEYLIDTLVHKGNPKDVRCMCDILRHYPEFFQLFYTEPELALLPSERKTLAEFELALVKAFSKPDCDYIKVFFKLIKQLPSGFSPMIIGQQCPAALLTQVRSALFDLFITKTPEKLPAYLRPPMPTYQHDDIPWSDSKQDPFGRTWPKSSLPASEAARIKCLQRATNSKFPRFIPDTTARTFASHHSSCAPVDSVTYDHSFIDEMLNPFENDMVLATSPLMRHYYDAYLAVNPEGIQRLPIHKLWSPDRNERRDIRLQILHNEIGYYYLGKNPQLFRDNIFEENRLHQYVSDMASFHKALIPHDKFLHHVQRAIQSVKRGISLSPFGYEGSELFLWTSFANDVLAHSTSPCTITFLKQKLAKAIEPSTYRASLLTSVVYDFDQWLSEDDTNYFVFTSIACLVSFAITAVLAYFGISALLGYLLKAPEPLVDLQSLSKGQLARLNKAHKVRFQARKKTGDKKKKFDGKTGKAKTKHIEFNVGEIEKLSEETQVKYQTTLQQNIVSHINKIGANILGFKFLYGPDKSASTYGLISNKRVFITAHFFEVNGLDFTEVQILNGDTTLHRLPASKVTVARLPGRDQCTMDLPEQVASSPSLTFMSKVDFANFDLDRYQVARLHKTIRKGVTNIQCVTGNNLRPGVSYEDQLTTLDGSKVRWKIDDFIVCVGSQGESGDCSLPYVACDRTTGKVFVLGTHFARLQDDSYVCPLFESDKNNQTAYQSSDKVQYQSEPVTRKGAWLPPCVTETKSISKQAFSGRLNALGELKVANFIPSDTNLIPSAFQGGGEIPPVKPITGFPALLRPTIFEDGDGELVRPLHNAVEKIVSPTVTVFPESLLEWAEKEPGKAFAGFTPQMRKEFRVLSIEEALEHLSQDTSIGYDMKVLGFTSRKEMWTKDETTGKVTWVHPLVRAAVEEIFDAMKKGYEPRNVVAACLKDEIRDELRVRMGKTRLFCVGGFAHLVATVMVMGDIVSFMKEHLSTSDVAIGVNPHSKDWTMLIRKLLKFPNLGGGDFKNYDTSIVSEFAYLLYRCLRLYTNWYITNSLWDWYLRCICMSAVAPVMVIGTEAYLMDWMNSSGGWLTGFINSFVNVVIFNYYFETVCQQNNLDLVREEHLAAWFYGDDNAWSVSDTMKPYFTMRKLGDFISKNFGMEYTTAEKTEIKDDFITIDQLEFLCRRFKKWDPESSLYHAQLSEDSIAQMLLWIRKPKASSGVSVQQQLSINVEQAMMEYYHYGQQRFEAERQLLYQYSVRYTIPWQVKEFSEYHRRFSDGVLYC
jgi:hypothetical protein